MTSIRLTQTLKEVIFSMLTNAAKFICGFLFGELIWCAVVKPYRHYYDFELTISHWPEVAFSIAVGAVFMLSLAARSTITLFLPSMIGSATQNYIIVLLFSTLASNPVANIALNSVESMRVIGCSLTLTFDQLRERVKLVLNPIVEILSDQEQKDLDPLRRDLVRIQHMVAEIRRNAQLKPSDRGTISSMTEKDTNTNKGRNHEQQSAETNITHSDVSRPAGERAVHVGAAATTEVTVGTGSGSTPGRHESASAVDLEWDLENFGVKANVDMNKLRALAREGKLKLYFGPANNNTASINLTDILYASCLNIFHEAKRECVVSVEELGKGCKQRIGPYFATFWCAPFFYSFESFCPWIMDQLVDEKSLCKQVKIGAVSATGRGDEGRQAPGLIKLGN